MTSAEKSSAATGAIAILPDGTGVCLSGQWRGWLFRRHPDGQWVSVQKLETVDPFAGSPLAALFSLAKASRP